MSPVMSPWLAVGIVGVLMLLVGLGREMRRIRQAEHPSFRSSLGGGSTPAEGDPPVTLQGDETHPGDPGHDAPPCVAAPPQGVSRPNADEVQR